MIETADYQVTLHSIGPKEGVAQSAEAGLPPVRVTSPPEFGGPEGDWSPEHLFVASVASCFMNTLMAIAELSRLEVLNLDVPAVGTIERGEDRRYRFVRVVLKPRLRLSPGAHRERAERIVHKAEEACLVSRSLTTEVSVEPTVEIEGESSAEGPA